MRQNVHLKLDTIAFTLHGYLLTESMVRHLIPYADEVVIFTGGRSFHLLLGLAHEGVVKLQTREEIADTVRTEDIMTHVDG